MRQVRAALGRWEQQVEREQWPAAEASAQRAEAAAARRWGADMPITLQCRAAVAVAQVRLGRRAEAEEVLRRSIRAAAGGVSGAAMAQARTVLAEVVRLGGGHAEAVETARSALATEPEATVFGPFSARRTLGLALGDLGRHDEAAACLAAHAARVPGSGEGAAEHLWARTNRLTHLAYLGRHQEVAEEAAAIGAHTDGVSGSVLANRELTVLSVRNSLAFSLTAQGRFQEAEAVLRPAVDEALGLGYEPFARTLQLGIARCLVGQGRAGEAWEALAALDGMAERTPVSAKEAGAVALGRASALLALDRLADAEQEARRAVELSEGHLGPSHHRRLEAATVLGTALSRRGRAAAAVELLTAGHDAWLAHFGEDHHGTRAARAALAGAGASA
ncbi:tetratricopeptide repeat protein [Kitasatospora sp. NPDC059571]|uniref:tetratricopeptide repeat protein n=1 Tax=Kitasatospora sp. NPDC059571 TaxID=3346871 RepID=UPI0036833FB5